MLSGESRLCFRYKNDYPDKIAYVPAGAMSAGGTKHGRNVYSFLGMELGRGDMKNALALKRALDEMPGTKDSTVRWEVRVARARAFATAMAHDKGITKNVEKISYIAAHCAAGYGPISMLLDDRNVNEVRFSGRRSTLSHALLGECRTNMLLVDAENMITTIELDSRAVPDDITVEASLDRRSLSAGRHNQEMNPSYLIREGFVSAEEMAYLWMAIESDMNMLVVGKGIAIDKFLHAASMMVQRSKRVAVVADNMIQTRISCSSNTIMCSSLDGIGRADVDLIMVHQLNARNAASFLKRAMRGQPIIAGIRGESLPSVLRVVDGALLSRLDVNVNVQTAHKVDQIAECMWFANGELEEMDCEDPSKPSLLQISLDGALNKEVLTASKVLCRYSKKYAVSLEDAAKELQKRSRFLCSCTEPSAESYWALPKA